jgi:hypothetical protein
MSHAFLNQPVVLDLSSAYVFIGTLVAEEPEYLVLEEVDAHDLRDSPTTREKYILDVRQHGIRPNRRRAWISRRELVSISLLADVLLD